LKPDTFDQPAVQDYYPDELAHCYGCGRLNEYGLHIQSRWMDAPGGKTIAKVAPRSYHTAIPGFVYGGLIASLVDCHGTGSAALAGYHAENRSLDSLPAQRFVTAALHVDYLRPTPMFSADGDPVTLELIGEIQEVKLKEARTKKVVVHISVLALGEVTARGEVVAVQMPDTFRSAHAGD
jgi:acyl-coenzyme A thioesterase PaaI-like protein